MMDADLILSSVAAIAATFFTLDLVRDLTRRQRPHVVAYAVGIGMFALATWALVWGLATGWTGATYRVFYLLGAVLNIPYLALGSMFLVVGRKSGHVMNVLLAGFSAISVTIVSTAGFQRPVEEWARIPSDVFPPITAGFGPRLLAAIGGSLGAVLLIVLALISLVRFWRTNRRIVAGNALIVAGTFAAAWGGTQLALGNDEIFSASLLVTATLLWAGYRTASGARRRPPRTGPLVVLVGPSTESPERAHAELMISALEQAGYRVMCPARDIEEWGAQTFSPAEVMQRTFQTIEEAKAVVVDLAHGYGTVAAGYAAALRIPVIVASPEGERIPRPLRGVAALELYYHSCDQVARRISAVFKPSHLGRSADDAAPAASPPLR